MKGIRMAEAPIYLVDFDGVVCDSRFECMITSHVAYRQLFHKQDVAFDANTIAPDAARYFIQYRYLARTAREFALLWECLDAHVPVNEQGWSRMQAEADDTRLRQFHDAFYTARYRWAEADHASWLAVHSLFGPMKDRLTDWLAQERAHIVSSKDSRSILALLRHHGIDVHESLVNGCEGGDKIAHFQRLRQTTGRPLIFIDDHLDNLRMARASGIAGCLASWGYTSEHLIEKARKEEFPVLTLDMLGQLD